MKIILISSLLLLLISETVHGKQIVKPRSNYTLTIDAHERNFKTLYLIEYGNNNIYDSALVNDGYAVFQHHFSAEKYFIIQFDREDFLKIIIHPQSFILHLGRDGEVVRTCWFENSILNTDLTTMWRDLFAIGAVNKTANDSIILHENDKELQQIYINRVDSLGEEFSKVALEYMKRTSSPILALVASAAVRQDNKIFLLEEAAKILEKRFANDLECHSQVRTFQRIIAERKNQISLQKLDYNLIVYDLLEKKINLQAYKGKILLIDFWGTWCAPCLELLPEIEKICEKFSYRSDFQIVSVACENNIERLKAFFQDSPARWPQLYTSLDDTDKRLLRNQLQIQLFPTFLLVDKDGKMLMRGSIKYELSAIKRKLETLFKE